MFRDIKTQSRRSAVRALIFRGEFNSKRAEIPRKRLEDLEDLALLRDIFFNHFFSLYEEFNYYTSFSFATMTLKFKYVEKEMTFILVRYIY